MASSSRLVPRPPRQRSAVTNSPYHIAGVDKRSAAGRRYRDIVDGVIAEFGSSNPESIRELAGLKFTMESLQAAVVMGGTPRAAEDMIRVTNAISRRERLMRQAKAATERPLTISEYLASKAAAENAAEDDDQ